MAITVYTYNDKVLKNVATDKWLAKKEGLVLPGWTVRFKLASGSSTPTIGGGTVTAVQGQADVYDVCTEGEAGKRNNIWGGLFQGVSVIEVLGANVWDSSHTQVANLLGMFNGCTSLTSVSLFDTSSVTNMSSMFQGCSSLTTVPLFDTSSVTKMQSMFSNCTSLTTVPLFDTSSVTDMSNMIYGCTSLTSVPLFDTSSVTDMTNMSRGCSSLTTVPLLDTSSVTNMDYAFYQCDNVQSGALSLYQQASTQTTPPSSHIGTFGDCGRLTVTGAAELAQIPTSWGGTGA